MRRATTLDVEMYPDHRVDRADDHRQSEQGARESFGPLKTSGVNFPFNQFSSQAKAQRNEQTCLKNKYEYPENPEARGVVNSCPRENRDKRKNDRHQKRDKRGQQIARNRDDPKEHDQSLAFGDPSITCMTRQSATAPPALASTSPPAAPRGVEERCLASPGSDRFAGLHPTCSTYKSECPAPGCPAGRGTVPWPSERPHA